MLKACTFIHRKPGMLVEEFQTYWRNIHADIVVQLPNVRRYVQSHPLIQEYKKRNLIYDGLAEIWVDNTDVLRTMTATDAYKDVVDDEANFIDQKRTELILTEEHVIKDGLTPADGVKRIGLLVRKPGMDVESFQRYWRGVHGKLASKIPSIHRYVQSHTKLSGYRREPQPNWDGIAATWFDSVDEMRAGRATEAYKNTRADEGNFFDAGESKFLITKEHTIIS